jgi:hypothetical protein
MEQEQIRNMSDDQAIVISVAFASNNARTKFLGQLF